MINGPGTDCANCCCLTCCCAARHANTAPNSTTSIGLVINECTVAMPALMCAQLSGQLHCGLNQLRLSRLLCDCTIVLQQQQHMLAHRLVLAAASPFFCQLFAHTGAEPASTLDLSMYPAEAVRRVVEFIYTGELNVVDCEPCQVLALANHCQLDCLQRMLASLQPLKRPTTADTHNNGHRTPDGKATAKRPFTTPQSAPAKRFCPQHFLLNCVNCAASTSSSAASSLVYRPSPKLPAPMTLFDLPLMQCAAESSSGSEQLMALRSSWLQQGLLSPMLTGRPLVQTPQASPLSSGIHSGPTDTPTFSANKKQRSQGVRTSPSHSTPQRMIKDKDEGWCRNKKYIERVSSGYMCTVCGKVYGRYNSVSYHVTIYHRNPPIQCDQPGCQFSTREARYIHFHRYYRHGTPLPQSIDLSARSCPFCRHVSKSPAMLEKHIRRHEEQASSLASPLREANATARAALDDSETKTTNQSSSQQSSRAALVDGGDGQQEAEAEVPLDLSPTAAPPPSRCVSSSEHESSKSSLDDEHSVLANTHTTGYHSMINYGTV